MTELSIVEEAIELRRMKMLADKKSVRLQKQIDKLVKEMSFTEKDQWIEATIHLNESEGKI